MDDILKQRLVGALILVALGVVFWPIIFVEPGDKAVAQQSTIPPRPGVATTPIAAPDQAGLRASPERVMPAEMEPVQASAPEPELSGAVAEKGLVEKDLVDKKSVEENPPPVLETPAPAPIIAPQPVQQTRSESPKKLALDADGVPVAWILQVASVSSADKADQLRQRLLKMGHKAYVKKIQRGGRGLYRVYIGPKFERRALEKMQAPIDAEFAVTSIIARYYP